MSGCKFMMPYKRRKTIATRNVADQKVPVGKIRKSASGSRALNSLTTNATNAMTEITESVQMKLELNQSSSCPLLSTVCIVPSHVNLQDYIGSDYQRLGDLDEKLGDLNGARADFEAGLAVRQKISAADPTNTDLQYYVSAFLRRLGDLAVKQGDLAGARKAYEDCLAIRQRLSASDPSSAQLQNAVALDLEDLAGVAFSQNDLATARADYDACLAIRRQLADADPTNAALQQLILRAMARSARVAGSSVSWRDVAVQYQRIEQAHQLTPGDEKVLQALRFHGFAAGLLTHGPRDGLLQARGRAAGRGAGPGAAGQRARGVVGPGAAERRILARKHPDRARPGRLRGGGLVHGSTGPDGGFVRDRAAQPCGSSP